MSQTDRPASRIIPIAQVSSSGRPIAEQAKRGALLDSLPPLSLYIHVPWCVRKCPYCDFNSHQQIGEIPEADYLEALAADLEQTLPLIWGRQIHTVFIGGGTPSLLSGRAIDSILALIRSYLNLWPDAEITLEANPGAVEADRFKSYAASGINRVSLGIQSFNDQHLKALGRVHDVAEANRAIELAVKHFDRVNLDLMFGLPNQTRAQSLDDASQALAFGTEHLSMYQLTIEPNTVFAKYPPLTPEDDSVIDMELGLEHLAKEAGLVRYEVSAFARAGAQARHNLNYWEFGDYIGIGPGAHGKLSFPDRIERFAKLRQPESWIKQAKLRDNSHLAEQRKLSAEELPFEFMLNALRLREGVDVKLYTERTGQQIDSIRSKLERAMDRGLLSSSPGRFQATALGWRFLNDLQSLFL